MSSIYNVVCGLRNICQDVYLVGGGVVSATPSKLLVCRGSTQSLVVQGLYDNEAEEFWTTNDSASGTLLDEFGNTIIQVPLIYNTDSDGVFSGDFGGLSFYPNVGRGYTLLILGERSTGSSITLPILAEVIPQPIFTGVGSLPSAPTGGGGGGGGGGGESISDNDHYYSVPGINARLVVTGYTLLTGYNGFVPPTTPYAVYIKLFDTATVPVPGVTPVKMTIGVEAGIGTPSGPNTQIVFQNGIGMVITKNPEDTDSTGINSGDCIIDTFYNNG
jgi:hypothetical protein